MAGFRTFFFRRGRVEAGVEFERSTSRTWSMHVIRHLSILQALEKLERFQLLSNDCAYIYVVCTRGKCEIRNT